MAYSELRLTPARRIELKRTGIRLREIIARLAVLNEEFRKLNAPRTGRPQ